MRATYRQRSSLCQRYALIAGALIAFLLPALASAQSSHRAPLHRAKTLRRPAPDALDLSGPRVTLRVPDRVDGMAFPVTVEAEDPSGVVSVAVALDGNIVATRTDPPYRFSVTAPQLPVRVRVVATDRFGNAGTADAVVDGMTDCACPKIYEPVCGVDGHTYPNACSARCARVDIAHAGECDPDACQSNMECGERRFCELPAGSCDDATAKGRCQERPVACTREYVPVCGCDGHTYSNDCERRAAGVALRRRGTCDQPPICGGIAGFPCSEGQSCDLRDPRCQTADLAGHCVATPEACPEIYSPVCACNGETYANDCERLKAGATLALAGACRQPCQPPPDLKACTDDEDCVVVDSIGCCSCSGGGAQAAINRNRRAALNDFKRRCCDHIFCAQVFNCRDGLSARCERGTCVLQNATSDPTLNR